MEILGIIFIVLIAIAIVVALVTAVVSIPDVRRYLRIRQM